VIVALALAVLLAAAGALWRVGAPFAARWWEWSTVLAFGAACLLLPTTVFAPAAARVVAGELTGQDAAARTALLQAAGQAGPRAGDLRFAWRDGAGPDQRRAFGALVTVPPPLELQPEAIQVRCAGVPAVGRPVRLEFVSPQSPQPLPGELQIHDASGAVLTQSVVAGAGTQVVAFTPRQAGEHRLAWTAAHGGRALRATGALLVAGAPRVLVLEAGTALAAALRAQGIDAVAAEAMPAELTDLAAIVVARPLPIGEQAVIAEALRDGLGAFVLAPGFASPGEPLHELLPLRVRPAAAGGDGTGTGGTGPAAGAEPPPEGPPRGDLATAGEVGPEPIEVDKRAVAMVLVVDRSGSMGTRLPDGNTKMSYARTSAWRTAQALGEGDTVGIVTFGNKDQPVVVLPMTDATERDRVRAGIERLVHAREGTFLLGGLRQAYELLAATTAAVKHVVVITDGEFHTSEEFGLGHLANRMREAGGITVSIISIVDQWTDGQFKVVAERVTKSGGGEFFQVTEASGVPALVSAEVARSLTRAGRPPRPGQGGAGAGTAPAAPSPPTASQPAAAAARLFAVRAVAQSALLEPEPERDGWPMIGDAVASTAPHDAQVLLIAGDDGWPLLAFGNRGLGRIGVFAADLAGPAGEAFRRERAFPGRLAAWIQHVARVVPGAASMLLRDHCVAPPAPTPREVAALTAFAGAPPSLGDLPALPPPWRRQLAAADAWPWLLAALVLLAAVERLAAARARQRLAA
jgi:Mg-chelatase subunit ChlD